MRACPRCGDLSAPDAVLCETSNYALIEHKAALAELRSQRSRAPVRRGLIQRCPYCGERSRGPCELHAGLEASA